VYYDDGQGDSPLTVHYAYNAYGQPVLRSLGSSLDRVWVYDRGQLLGEFDAANGEQRVAEYLYNPGVDDPYGVITGATTPTRIDYLKLDESGSVLGAYEGTTITMTASYDDWGVPSTGGQYQVGNLLWKSLHHDEYTGLYYVRARWYDPSLGRFMSEDPAGFAGGVNPYTFADDDPIDGIDPSGMHGGTIFGWIGKTLFGSIGEALGNVFSVFHGSKMPKAHPTFGGLARGANPGDMGSFPYLRYAVGAGPLPPHNYFGTNYCGPGGSGRYTSATDAACAQHDACYAKNGISAVLNTDPNSPATAAQLNAAQGCNQQLCTALTDLNTNTPASSAQSPMENFARDFIIMYFQGRLGFTQRLKLRPGTSCH
jgi:RHS repeat-associated protein